MPVTPQDNAGTKIEKKTIQKYGHTGIRAFGHTGIRAFGHSGIRAFGFWISDIGF
ncbi:MAG: hypothetical protein V2A67_10715 [Bacteroidota bacterium]